MIFYLKNEQTHPAMVLLYPSSKEDFDSPWKQ